MNGLRMTSAVALLAFGLAALPAASGATPRKERGSAPPAVIAVLPFINACEDNQADRKVMGVLVTQLMATRLFTVIEPALVESHLGELRARGQLDSAQMKQVAEKSGARLLLVGTITEYGQSRATSGAAVTVAMDARLVDARAMQILWAGSVTRTAQEREGFLFGSSTPSLSKVTQRAVQDLVREMGKESRRILEVASSAPAPMGVAAAAAPSAAESPVGAPAPAAEARFVDDGKRLTPDDLKALLPAVEGAERGEVVVVNHPTGRVRTSYRAGGTQVEVTLSDCGKADQAKSVVRVQSGAAAEGAFEDLPAYTSTSSFGAVHLNIAAGRFGVYLRAPASQEELLRKVASGVLKGLR